MKIVAFSPIRLNSKRVVGKNLKTIGGKPLLCHIFDTLKNVDEINEIYAFCSSEEIIPLLPDGVNFLKRNENLDDDMTLGADIYDAFVNTIDADIYVLAHTTSPFIKAQSFSKALSMMIGNNHDSALSVEKIQTFSWYNQKPLNYSLSHIPRTQDIEPIYVETSGFYMFRKEVWSKKKQRIGDNPYFMVIDKIEGIDIDTTDDFNFAETIATNLRSVQSGDVGGYMIKNQ